MSTQKQIIVNHMRKHGSITTLIATKRYDICRLSERIREIKSDFRRARTPALINNVPVRRNGKRYVAYSLVEGKRARAA